MLFHAPFPNFKSFYCLKTMLNKMFLHLEEIIIIIIFISFIFWPKLI